MSELAKALVEAQRIARAVEKDSTNKFHSYRYASAEAMIAEARGALSQAGLAFSCVSSALEQAEGYGRILVTMYRLDHVGGESRDYGSSTPIIEERGRPLDKAVATAKTYDLGYMLRSLLLLPRVEEGTDVDQRDDRKHEPAKAPTHDLDITDLVAEIEGAKSTEDLLKASNEIQALFKSGQISREQRMLLSKTGKARRIAIASQEADKQIESMGPMPEGY